MNIKKEKAINKNVVYDVVYEDYKKFSPTDHI